MGEAKVIERPILFSGPMVRAILEGRKTMTRRLVKPQPRWDGRVWHFGEEMFFSDEEMKDHLFHEFYGAKGTPFGSVYEHGGDRLWVRETWGLHDTEPKDGPDGAHVYFRATDGDRHELRYQLWRPSIFMPRWACRITLEITDIRVERLQQITEEDAIAEGFNQRSSISPKTENCLHCGQPRRNHVGIALACFGKMGRVFDNSSYRGGFATLWDVLNIKRGFGWDQNPWVWVISFRRIDDHGKESAE